MTAEVIDGKAFAAILRERVGAPVGLPAWRWMLEPAMWALRTEPELVLKSRWVHPGVLLDTGYAFRYPTIDEALAEKDFLDFEEPYRLGR